MQGVWKQVPEEQNNKESLERAVLFTKLQKLPFEGIPLDIF